MKIISIITAVAIGLFCAEPSLAQLPKKPAPRGMLEVATGSTGRILTSRMGGTRSARKMLMALKMVSGEYFDAPITLRRPFVDRTDTNLQAAFQTTLKGTPVRGVVAVRMDGEGGQGTLLFDNAKVFTKSFRALQTKQNSGDPKNKASAPIKLTRQTAPDGSTQISLPPGFVITGAYKGTLDIVGPNNATMALGSPTLVTRHEAGGMFPGIPTVDFNDPVRALIDYLTYMGRKGGVRVETKILDYRPIKDWTTGRAAYVRYSVRGAGKTMEGFGLFSIAQTDANQGLFYQSFIAATPENYRTQFPAMIAAWGTYSINPSVFTERLIATAQSMRGMSDLITSNTSRQQSSAKVNEAWSDLIRDQSTWRDTTTGERYKIPDSLTDSGGIPMQNGVALEPVPLHDL